MNERGQHSMHTVIIGGGFAGIKTALELSRYQAGKITLISERPYFLHHASLYSTATGHDPRESMIPLDEIFAAHPEVTVVQDTLKSLDPERNLAVCRSKDYHYDNLVMALGSEIDYGGNKHAADHTYSVRNMEQITRFHDHLHETLARDHHVDRNYVIVGGGLTGVELAGALKQYIEQLAALYVAKKAKVRITLVESESRLLPNASLQASYHVERRLASLGVSILKNCSVHALDSEQITVGNKKIPTETVIWTTGVRNNVFYAKHPQYFDVSASGHVQVNPYFEAYRNIYVLGDNVAIRGSGQVKGAYGMAVFLADHLVRKATTNSYVPYRAKHSPLTVPVGDDWAYAEYMGVYVTGWLGKLIHERHMYDGYRQIMSKAMADAAVASHTTKIDNL